MVTVGVYGIFSGYKPNANTCYDICRPIFVAVNFSFISVIVNRT